MTLALAPASLPAFPNDSIIGKLTKLLQNFFINCGISIGICIDKLLPEFLPYIIDRTLLIEHLVLSKFTYHPLRNVFCRHTHFLSSSFGNMSDSSGKCPRSSFAPANQLVE